MIKAAECGIERGNYALRWKIDIESRQTRPTQNDPDHARRPQLVPPPRPPPESPEDGSLTQSTTNDNSERQPEPTEQPPSTQLRPRFGDGDCSQAPRGPPDIELSLRQVKRRILAAYKNHRSPNLNHSQVQLKSLKNLASNVDIIVKRSDKCKGLVVMNKDDYASKMHDITENYEKVANNPTPKLEASTKRLIHDSLDGNLEDKVVKCILPQCSRTAELYGLPKDHKVDIPLRPIVSACGDPLDKLTWILERVITQLLPFIPAHLKNTTEFLDKVRRKYPEGFEPGTILFSVDVVNLYGNIPVQEGIQACMSMLREHEEHINMFSMAPDDIERLLQHCLTQNFVRFGSTYFRQQTGIAMGSRVAPPLAIAFMHILETTFLSSDRAQPSLYLRYIDDIFGVWHHGLPSLLEYVEFLNSVHPSIQFTLEHTATTGTLPYLDTLIKISETGQYTTELFIKPMSANVILHFNSAQPMSVKRATARSQYLRALRLSSPGDPTDLSLQKIDKLFLANGYPRATLHRARQEAIKTHHKTGTQGQRNQLRAHKTPLVLPFVDDRLCNIVQGIIKSSDIAFQVTWKGGETVGQKLVKSALSPPPCPGGGKRCNACCAGLAGKCHSKNTIYRIDCSICPAGQSFYIGESRRSIRKRFNEHLGDARNKRTDTPFGAHQNQHQHTPLTYKNLKLSILSRATDGPDRKIKESIFIRDLRPTLNTQTSSWPLTPGHS